MVDMGENAEERAVLRGAVRANSRVWLSQVLSASGRAVLTTTGIPEVEKWKNIVLRGIHKRSGEGRSRLPVLDLDSRTTPGCIMKGDVVITQQENGRVQLWVVRSVSANTTRL